MKTVKYVFYEIEYNEVRVIEVLEGAFKGWKLYMTDPEFMYLGTL